MLSNKASVKSSKVILTEAGVGQELK
jgi:hypothetical protein